jgi:hypothetical protein
MAVQTPRFAPFVALAFLGTGFVLVLCLLTALIGALRRSRGLILTGIAAGVMVALIYGAVLLGFSLLNREVELPPGGWKYFCELDCHIAYAVESVQVARCVGPEMEAISKSEKFVIVQVKTWFDPATISPQRGDGPLMPNERRVSLLDGAGHCFSESPRAGAILGAARLQATPLRTPLRPGESYVTCLVFEVPKEASRLRLLLASADEEDVVIWGHENSPFHRKAYLLIPTPERAGTGSSL